MKMNSFKVNCPHCGQPLEVPVSMAHSTCVCPTCKGLIEMASLAGEIKGDANNPEITQSQTQQSQSNENNSAKSEQSFCTKCGTRLEDNALFCTKCGSRRQNASGAEDRNDRDGLSFENESPVFKSHAPKQEDEICEKWAWCLAVIPSVAASLIYAEFPSCGRRLIMLIYLILTSVFKHFDKTTIEKKGWKIETVLTAVYLFSRASRYTKRYDPAIIWCFLFIWFFFFLITYPDR